MLMKAVCFFSPELEKYSDQQKRRQSIIDDGPKHHHHHGGPVSSYRQSKIRPVSSCGDTKTFSKPLRQNSLPMFKSPISGLRQLVPVAVDMVDGESDTSGYEGDTELWTQRWWAGAQRYQEEENEEGLVTGVGGTGLMSPAASIRAPLEIKKRIWLESPIWQCIELLKECLEDKETAEKW